MKKYIILVFAFKAIQSNAQSIQRSVLGSSGNVSTSSSYKLSYTLGETFTKKTNASGLNINQGFQQGINLSLPLPVNGLDFFAKRINPTQVQLYWKTSTEINNKGFHIQRKKENDVEFTTLKFQPSLSMNGNSNLALNYSYQDENTYPGITYYQLKQEDIDGKFNYSIVRVVNGETESKLTINAWPIPANDFINISINGIQNEEVVELVDMNGKIINSITINNPFQQHLNLIGLSPGIYFIRMKSDDNLSQKILVE